VREGIHPEYIECKVMCSCGNTFLTRATIPEMHLELCSECHPFYTGQQKFVDTGGRVQRFEDKFGSAGTKVLESEEVAKQDRIKASEESAEAIRQEAAKRAEERAKRRIRPKVAKEPEPVAKDPEEAVVEETAAEVPEEAVEAPAEDVAEETKE